MITAPTRSRTRRLRYSTLPALPFLLLAVCPGDEERPERAGAWSGAVGRAYDEPPSRHTQDAGRGSCSKRRPPSSPGTAPVSPPSERARAPAVGWAAQTTGRESPGASRSGCDGFFQAVGRLFERLAPVRAGSDCFWQIAKPDREAAGPLHPDERRRIQAHLPVPVWLTSGRTKRRAAISKPLLRLLNWLSGPRAGKFCGKQRR